MDEKGGRDNDDRAKEEKVIDDVITAAARIGSGGGGYNQTYIILSSKGKDAESKYAVDGHEVFFRCGNWCYKGRIQFNGLRISTSDLPVIIPTLQKQQGSLRYFCNSNSVPIKSEFYDPLKFLTDAADFVGSEMISDHVDKELRKMSSVFPWIDDDAATTYFELALGNVPDYMDTVGLVATKTYTRGLIIISVYHDRAIYFVIQSGEGDQPLLDVRFPDISKHGQGLHISSYNNPSSPYKKLTLWHILVPDSSTPVIREIPKLKTLSVASKNYEQTYCIMKSSWDIANPTLSVHHDVLFRFGSWCYAGRVQLTPSLTLSDIPFVIPALRMQQSRLDYICDVNNIPTTSPFAATLDYVNRIAPLIEQEISSSEETLNALIDRLTKMGLGESVAKWLEGDPANSFFEFKVAVDQFMSEAFKSMELVASKCYYASGIITITIIFQNTIYVSVLDGSNENPLLDSRFPDVSGKGRGYQIQAYSDGIDGWSGLRKVSIWQTVGALEQEFRDRAAQLAQSKNKEPILLSEKDVDESFEAGFGGGGKDVDNNNDEDDEIEVGTFGSMNSNAPETEVPLLAEEKNTTPRISSSTSTSTSDKASSSMGGASSSSSSSASSFVSPEKSSGFESDLGIQKQPVRGGNLDLSPFSSAKEVGSSSSSSSSLGRDLDAEVEGGGVGRGEDLSIASPGGGSFGNSLSSSMGNSGGLTKEEEPQRRMQMARPHHLPKMESLSKRMEEIRKTMGPQDTDAAPWDAFGKPFGGGGGGGSGGGMKK